MLAPPRHVCPVCGRPSPPLRAEAGKSSFPFCSPACKLVDLGRWLDGGYRIPGPPESALSPGSEGGEDE